MSLALKALEINTYFHYQSASHLQGLAKMPSFGLLLHSHLHQEPQKGVPQGGGPPPNTTSNRRLQQTQAQVEEVVDIMRVNVDKVLERDQKLSELDDRADALQAGASQFESSAAKLKRKYWWKNCKMMIMLGAICAIIVVIIVKTTCHPQKICVVFIPGQKPFRRK
ncbi:vesicle-associated membrane protein 1 isoform X2 [Petaurus breviceps papuanus]|uniref:vesicle-associated membrane protein 1 isoform X2 n=1 Tax=Petaurus breviceps papuanus TaxID=3040969 RepID=UPI0036D957C2